MLTYDGAPAFTQFSSSSGGWTSAGSAPYLVAKQDPYDDWSGNPHTSWQTVISDGTIEKAFPGVGNLTGIKFSGRDGNGEWGGRVDTVTVTGSAGIQDRLRRGLPVPARAALGVGQPDRDRRAGGPLGPREDTQTTAPFGASWRCSPAPPRRPP